MSVNANAKGKRCERQVVAWLRELGYESARRGEQYKGTADSPDIDCKELWWINIESKGRASFPSTAEMEKWLVKAEADCGPNQRALLVVLPNRRPPILVYRRHYPDVWPWPKGIPQGMRSGVVQILDPDPACAHNAFLELYLQVKGANPEASDPSASDSTASLAT